jgi:hypothetical protein
MPDGSMFRRKKWRATEGLVVPLVSGNHFIGASLNRCRLSPLQRRLSVEQSGAVLFRRH